MITVYSGRAGSNVVTVEHVNLCDNCKAKLPTMRARLKAVNSALYNLGLVYHQTVPFELVDGILEKYGFATTSEATNEAGTRTSFHANVGCDKWVHISWHRMESGRYEVVAYVN